MPNTAKSKTHQESSGNATKGLAFMPHKQVEEIARKGGQESADKAGHEGMSERSRKGGEARVEQLGHKGGVSSHEPHKRQSASKEEEDKNKEQATKKAASGHEQRLNQPKEKAQEEDYKGRTHLR